MKRPATFQSLSVAASLLLLLFFCLVGAECPIYIGNAPRFTSAPGDQPGRLTGGAIDGALPADAETGGDETAVTEIDSELQLLQQAVDETREHTLLPQPATPS